jgi:hypothetical protein
VLLDWAAFVASVLSAHQRPSEHDEAGPDGDDDAVLAYPYSAVGRLLGKSASSVGRLVAEGRLDVIGNGSGRRVTAARLERYMAEEAQSNRRRAS